MVRQAPITQKTIGLNARIQETGGAMGGVQAKKQVAAIALNKSQDYARQSAENAYMQGQVTLTKDLDRIEKEHSGDPDNMGVAIDKYTEGFLNEVNDPNTRARYELQITKSAQSSLARANSKRQGIINEQAKFSNLEALEQIKIGLPNISEGLISTDDGVALAAAEQLQEAMMRTTQLVGGTDGNGVPLFGAAFRVAQVTALKETAFLGAAQSWMDTQPDKVAAEKAIRNGELELNMPDGDGGFEKINVRDSLSKKAQGVMEQEAKRQIAQQKIDLQNDQEKPFHLQINNEVGLRKVIDDPAIPIKEKIDKLNKLDYENGIRDEAAADFRGYLNSIQKAATAPPSQIVKAKAFDEMTADLQQLRVEFGGSPEELNQVELTPERMKAFQAYQSKVYRKLTSRELDEADKKRLLDPITAAVSTAIHEKNTTGKGWAILPGIQDPFGDGLTRIDRYLKNQGRENSFTEKKELFDAFSRHLGDFDEKGNYVSTGEYEGSGNYEQDVSKIREALRRAKISVNSKNFNGIIDDENPPNHVVRTTLPVEQSNTFKTEAEAEAAGLNDGTAIIINGQRGVWRK